MRRRWLIPAGLAAALLPVWAQTPEPETVDGPDTIEGIVADCRASGLEGRELADLAIHTVARVFPVYSLWRVWDSPGRALVNHRGWSHQYNTVLLEVLRRLGFRARPVHAARVRGFNRPWWLVGHAWVRVHFEGHELDACASSVTNRLGDVPFVALTQVLPFRRVTRWGVGAAVLPFVVAEVWRAWLLGGPTSPWLNELRHVPDAGRGDGLG